MSHGASAAEAGGCDGAVASPALASTETLDRVLVTAASDDDYRAETSTVGAKAPIALRDLPQSAIVINRAVLEAQGATSLQDALRNVPGITLGAAEGGQIGNNINLRGFSARTDVYRNGFRDRGQYYRDTFDLAAIEVLKGPSSMLFGRGSTGGVVNQASKEPMRKPVTDVAASVGSDDRYRVSADLDRPIGEDAAIRVNTFAQDVGSTREVVRARDAGVAPTVRIGIGGDTELDAWALVQHNRDVADYGIPALNGRPAAVSYGNFYGLEDDRTVQDVAVLGTRVERRVASDTLLRVQVQGSRYTTDARESSANTIVTDGGVTLDRTRGNYTTLPPERLFVQLGSRDRAIEDRAADAQADLVAKLGTGAVLHTLTGGFELGRDEYENQALARTGLPRLALLEPERVAQPDAVRAVPGNRARASADTAALYLNDAVGLGDAWQLVGGVRHDRYDARIDNSVSLPSRAAQDVSFTSARGGAIWQPSASQSYYVSSGTSFNPSLETLTATNGTQDLDPERNRSLELGAKWNTPDQKLDLTAAVFEVRKTDARTQVAPGEFTLDGDVRVRGAELGASGRIADDWQVFAGYAYLDAEVLAARDGTAGNTPANTPRHSASAWLTRSVGERWEVGGGAVAASSRFAANTDLVAAPGYVRWDATVAYALPLCETRLNVLNAFDKRYIEALVPSDGGRLVPGTGRAVLVSFTWHL